MIIATAGHVDHGKTALVKQLTGVDADRLAEEKSRELSIDLGFAYTPLEGGDVLGFVDVPGHERFVTNMLAGVAVIDYALLVVAADDGPMPQTDEHLAILDLLGIPAGVITVTKIDRVNRTRLAEVALEIAERVKGTMLEGASVFHVSNATGEGVEALRTHLHQVATAGRARPKDGNFRLAVDRRFTIQGAGLVVTGAAFSGSVNVGHHVFLSPRGLKVRIRRIHALNRRAETGIAGERLSLNLVGSNLSVEDIERGDWVVAEEAHNPTTRIDAMIRVLPGEDRPFRHWAPVHLHHGAADLPARAAVLSGRNINPGESGLVQLVLEHPTVAVHRDRFVLRDQSAQRTVAGGTVLDPFGPRRGRARASRVAVLEAMKSGDTREVFERLLAACEEGVDLVWFARTMNLTPKEAETLWQEVDFVKVGAPPNLFGLSRAHWERLRQEITDRVLEWNQRHPDSPGASKTAIGKLLTSRISPPRLSSALAALVREKHLRYEGHLYLHPDYQPPAQQRDALTERILPILEASAVPPPTVKEIAARLEVTPKRIQGVLNRAAKEGLVRRVSENRYFLPQTVGDLAMHVEKIASEKKDGLFRVTDFRDRTGIGRNPSIELLEYFDHVGFTRRIGDDRRVLRSASELFGSD